MKVFVTRYIPKEIVQLMEQHGLEVICNNAQAVPPQDELIRGCKDVDFLLNVEGGQLDAYFMESCKHLKGIALTTVGYDHVDLQAATKHNIPVSNTPDVVTKATADTALLLMLSVSRKAFYWAKQAEAGRGKQYGFFHELGTDIEAKTLGIFGLGRIGIDFARKAKAAFNMDIIYNNRNRNIEAEKLLGAKYVSFDELLAHSDVLSVHCSLNPETQYHFDADCFRKMKKSAIFINTARGKIHREPDLIEALQQGEIWGAGLDVTDPEPVSPDNPLLQMPNVCVLPHIGAGTLETRNAMVKMAAENIIALSQGKRMPQIVNLDISIEY